MAQGEDVAQAAGRLEAALERIAFAAEQSRVADLTETGGPRPVPSDVVARLDALIAQLRIVLGDPA